LSGFRLNFSQKTSEVCVLHVFEPISTIHLLLSSKTWSENCFVCLLKSWSKQIQTYIILCPRVDFLCLFTHHTKLTHQNELYLYLMFLKSYRELNVWYVVYLKQLLKLKKKELPIVPHFDFLNLSRIWAVSIICKNQFETFLKGS
jgi:hypothetical protein